MPSKRKLYIQYETMRMQKEQKHERKLSKAILEAIAPIYKALSETGTTDIALYDESIVFDALVELYRDTMGTFFVYQYRLVTKKDEATDAMNLFTERVEEWLRVNGGLKIKSINETIRQGVRDIITNAFNEGLDIPATAKLIQEESIAFSKQRATVIARTETVAGAGQGSLEGAKATGLTLRKIWLSAMDSRTRETHKEADRVHSLGIGMNDYFIVGTDRMQSPATGSVAEENCNCRCAIAFIT